MEIYQNLGGDSNVIAYENGKDFIKVEFASGRFRVYRYSHSHSGISNVNQMQILASSGHGLNSFIKKYKIPYESKN